MGDNENDWGPEGPPFEIKTWQKILKPESPLEQFKELIDYLKHDSWRCDYYQECHCGLNELTDKLGLTRIPFEGRYKR